MLIYTRDLKLIHRSKKRVRTAVILLKTHAVKAHILFASSAFGDTYIFVHFSQLFSIIMRDCRTPSFLFI